MKNNFAQELIIINRQYVAQITSNRRLVILYLTYEFKITK